MPRRDFLKAAAAVTISGLTASALGGWTRPVRAAGSVRVYVVVVDGLRPDEVTAQKMPFLEQLRTGGAWFAHANAEMVAETTPNHVAMLTGMRANRHGMPGNAIPAHGGELRVGDDPRYLKADTLFTLARRQAPGLVTASVTAKAYLVSMSKHDRTGDGQVDAGHTNTPAVVVPVSDSTPDEETMATAIQISREFDPDFLFVNLGDTDRVGHIDITGGAPAALPVMRTTQLQLTDALLRQLVADLTDRGLWDSTVLLVTADHAMDWSTPDATVSLLPAFAEDPVIGDEVWVALNGGAAMYHLKAPAEPEAPERLRHMRAIALAHEGVEEALYIRPNPRDGGERHAVGHVHPDWGLDGDRTGDLVVTCKPGYRLTDPGQGDNPIPGNHGHPVTRHIPMLVTGGQPGIRSTVVDAPGAGRNIDVAPTVAWLLGLHGPPGGFDGRALTEAFTQRPTPSVNAKRVPSVPVVRRVAGANRLLTATALAREAFPDGAGTAVVAAADQFADALTATPLAAWLQAPLLLSFGDTVAPEVLAEMERLGVTRTVLVGGERTLSPSVEDALRSRGHEVERIAGSNRYATASAVAARMAAPEEPTGEARTLDTVLLVAGEGTGPDAFADALAAGPVAAGPLEGTRARPVLLTRPDAVPTETMQALRELGARRVLVAGGTRAVSVGVEEALRKADLLVERLGGADRYGTASLLAERAVRDGAHTHRLYLVSGRSFADALAAGSAVARTGGILALVDPGDLAASPPTRELLTRRADEFVQIMVVGGTSAVSEQVSRQVRELVTAQRAR